MGRFIFIIIIAFGIIGLINILYDLNNEKKRDSKKKN